jgi:dTDP-glucose 4,6-dehydratase/UDP-glucuronate decarboxylase
LIGSHLCDALLDDGHDVTVIDNFVTGRRANIAHRHTHAAFRLIEADIVDGVPDLPFDQIYHLASPASPRGYMTHPIATHQVNSIGTQHLLDLARRYSSRFLFTSTSEIYGNPLVHPQPEGYFGNVNPIGPRSCYDESKRYGESLTMEYVRQFDLDARIVRLFNVYGPRNDPEDGRVMPNFIAAAQRGEPLPIYGDGKQTRSLCYVSDLVSGLRKSMEIDGLAGEVLNLGNPDERTVLDLAEIIIRLCDSSSTITYLPAREDDPERRCPDISKARVLIGWEPTVSLEDGLGETVAYFAANETVTV